MSKNSRILVAKSRNASPNQVQAAVLDGALNVSLGSGAATEGRKSIRQEQPFNIRAARLQNGIGPGFTFDTKSGVRNANFLKKKRTEKRSET